MMQVSGTRRLLLVLAALATTFSVAACEGEQATSADSAPVRGSATSEPQSAPIKVEEEDELVLAEPTVLEVDPVADTADPSDYAAVRTVLEGLEIKGRAPKTGYDRELFVQY
ncbi:hypothetical protein [Actinomyces minihominis]|uniref:hypothetical protein n=1 Tax=Actinomyces minihominis TaxID=2002838 RepID=UPI000C077F45|nr:hypothetical protein [Actinomyces minihominis]